eukprot:6194354-Pleurochrysis_carterae.AAC.3
MHSLLSSHGLGTHVYSSGSSPLTSPWRTSLPPVPLIQQSYNACHGLFRASYACHGSPHEPFSTLHIERMLNSYCGEGTTRMLNSSDSPTHISDEQHPFPSSQGLVWQSGSHGTELDRAS